jgi:hypothetical protein
MGMSPREQGDWGEFCAMAWFVDQGAKVYVPWGHSPDVDFVAEFDGRLVRVQVKTATFVRNDRFEVGVATYGGNQSWNGLVKRFGASRCDYLFVCVADGRRWFIPADAVEGGRAIKVGGPKYAAYEVERGRPLAAPVSA